MPFRIIHGLIVIELNVNHGPLGQFVVDTGSTTSVIGIDEAAKFGIKLNKSAGYKITGTGDEAISRASITHKVKLEYHGRAILEGTLPVVDLSGVSRLLSEPIAGILGFNVIRAHPTALDFSGRILTIFSTDVFRPPNNAHALSL